MTTTVSSGTRQDRQGAQVPRRQPPRRGEQRDPRARDPRPRGSAGRRGSQAPGSPARSPQASDPPARDPLEPDTARAASTGTLARRSRTARPARPDSPVRTARPARTVPPGPPGPPHRPGRPEPASPPGGPGPVRPPAPNRGAARTAAARPATATRATARAGRPSVSRTPFILLVVGLLGGGLICLLVINTTLAAGSFESTLCSTATRCPRSRFRNCSSRWRPISRRAPSRSGRAAGPADAADAGLRRPEERPQLHHSQPGPTGVYAVPGYTP